MKINHNDKPSGGTAVGSQQIHGAIETMSLMIEIRHFTIKFIKQF